MPLSGTEWEDQRRAVIPRQQYCFMSQRFFSVKTRFRAPDAVPSEVTYLVSRITERQCAKTRGTLSGLSLVKDTYVQSFLRAHATCNMERGPCTAKSRLTIVSGISETRTISLYLKMKIFRIFFGVVSFSTFKQLPPAIS